MKLRTAGIDSCQPGGRGAAVGLAQLRQFVGVSSASSVCTGSDFTSPIQAPGVNGQAHARAVLEDADRFGESDRSRWSARPCASRGLPGRPGCRSRPCGRRSAPASVAARSSSVRRWDLAAELREGLGDLVVGEDRGRRRRVHPSDLRSSGWARPTTASSGQGQHLVARVGVGSGPRRRGRRAARYRRDARPTAAGAPG
jgi:hypothetical protein